MVMKGTRRNNLYYLNRSTVIGSTLIVFAKDTDSKATRLWHMRLGHAGEKALQTLTKQGLLKGVNSCKLEFCEHFVLGKETRVKFSSAIYNRERILDYVHSDVWGPTKVASLGGMHYFVTFVDDYSRKVWVYLMKRKSKVLDTFLKWKKMMETQTGRKDTPQQNGVAEHINRTILEKVRCMLSNAGLGKEFWDEAVTYACHLINRLPSDVINGKTPMEMWTGKSATDYDSLHVFGSTAYYHVKESKLDPRAKKVLFLGITGGVKWYRLWCPNTRKIVFSRDVELEKVNDDPTNIRGTNDEEFPTQEPLQQQDLIAYRRPRREIRKPTRFDDIVAYALPIMEDDVSSTYTEVIRNPDGARLVAKGYTQKEGIGYNKVFSPVLRHSSIRILLALVAQYDFELVQLDVKTAFLHGDLEEEIYMTQPDGFKTKLVSTLLTSHFKLSTQLSRLTNTEREYMLQVLYSNAVGSLMYAMVCTRPDILQAVSIVSRYMHNPGKGHWQAVKWILRYIQKTVDVGLLFKQDNTLGKCVIRYVDSDYTGDLDKQRSTTGYVFTFAGGPISWKSTL
ncbi:hypothetical protein CXB51_024902 [Gossypium anomalum]|uniref:Integrase catalytic domain-containing protein n=1 Tax=Gossypium anomalum TaxID=47600 RepID=A0A8J5YPP4_9ROSI|nr:hypothetical protein CXB51_024902 [Gossypium anomalum]